MTRKVLKEERKLRRMLADYNRHLSTYISVPGELKQFGVAITALTRAVRADEREKIYKEDVSRSASCLCSTFLK